MYCCSMLLLLKLKVLKEITNSEAISLIPGHCKTGKKDEFKWKGFYNGCYNSKEDLWVLYSSSSPGYSFPPHVIQLLQYCGLMLSWNLNLRKADLPKVVALQNATVCSPVWFYGKCAFHPFWPRAIMMISSITAVNSTLYCPLVLIRECQSIMASLSGSFSTSLCTAWMNSNLTGTCRDLGS